MFISLIFNINWWTESKGCSTELSDFETPEITKCWLGDVKCIGSPPLLLPPLDPHLSSASPAPLSIRSPPLLSPRTLHRQCSGHRSMEENWQFCQNTKSEANSTEPQPLQANFPWTDSCSQQLGKNPFNSSFAWVKVIEFGLSSFLGRLGSMPCAEVLSRTWQGLSPPQHCLFGITLGNKLMSYTGFALQQKEGKRFSDKFLNHNPAKIYNKKFICKPLQCTELKSTPLHNDPCLNTWSQMQKHKPDWL